MTLKKKKSLGSVKKRVSRRTRSSAGPCTRFRARCSDYEAGLLGQDERRNYETHLATCLPCGHFAEQLKVSTNAARDALLERVPSDLDAKILGFIQRHQS